MKRTLLTFAALALAAGVCAADEWTYVGEIPYAAPEGSTVVPGSFTRIKASSSAVYIAGYLDNQLGTALHKYTPSSDDILTGTITSIDEVPSTVGCNGITGICCLADDSVVVVADSAGAGNFGWFKKYTADGALDTAFGNAGTIEEPAQRLSGLAAFANGSLFTPDSFVSNATTKYRTLNPTTGAAGADIPLAQPNPPMAKAYYRNWAARPNVTTGVTDDVFVAYGGSIYKGTVDTAANTSTAVVPMTTLTWTDPGWSVSYGVCYDATNDQVIFTNRTDSKTLVLNPNDGSIVQTIDGTTAVDVTTLTFEGKQYMFLVNSDAGGNSKIYVYTRPNAAVADWSQF